MKNQGIERANQMDVINWAIDNNMVSVPDDYNEAVRKVIFDRAAGKATANQGGGSASRRRSIKS